MKTNVPFSNLLLGLGCTLAFHSAFAFYSPSTGRWLNRDPIQEKGGKNIYATHNSSVNEVDALGLRSLCRCCECAVGISIANAHFEPRSQFYYPGWYFDIYIYLEYHPSSNEGRAKYQFWEKTPTPVPEVIRAGGRPNEWYNYFDLVPSVVPSEWSRRDVRCIPPVGRVVHDYDHTSAKTRQTWVVHWRLTVVNPKNCDCGPDVTVTAVMNYDANSPTGGSFSTPDSNP